MSHNDLRNLAIECIAGQIELPPATIVAILSAASDTYYNEGNEEPSMIPVIDPETVEVIGSEPYNAGELLEDAEYDALERLLRSLDPKNAYFLQVGSDVRGGKVPLPFKMGSLDQVYEGETEKWVKQHGHEREEHVISDKLDGTSVALVYDRKGNFNSAFSRGNGIMGADITRHIKKLNCVPKKVSGPMELRAEAIIPVSKWPEVKATTLARSGREYKNARNYVAGKMNASESDDVFIDNLHIVVTSVETPVLGKIASLEMARKEGFLVNYYGVMAGKDLVDPVLTDYLNTRRQESDYELDGIVIDVDDAKIRASLPKTSSSLNPTYARKFKVASADNSAITKVVKVHWRVSKAGYLKPRVEIEPVDLMGVTITYATGFNAAFIRDNKIGAGATIRITRAGDVIPYITEVITGTVADLPTVAEFGEMSYTDGEVDLMLDDPDASEDARFYRMLDAFTRLDVPFLKKGSLEKLIEAGFDSEAKIIKATEAELKAAVGDSAGKKIYSGLSAKLNPVDLALLAGASQKLGRGIGTRKATKIIDALGTLDVTVDQLVQVDGFERKTAEIVVRNYPKFKAFLDEIDGYYSIAEKVAPPADGDLKGIVVVFTGVRDKDLEAKIVARAGTIGSSVNKDTTHLVCKDPSSGSSKMKKASDLGVKIIDLSEAQSLWA